MKPDDLKFVREIRARINPAYAGVAGTESYERNRLLTLLYESEGMRKKAEFEKDHHCMRRLIAANDKITVDPPRGEPCIDERHYRSDEQWIAAVRKEIEGD